MAPAFGKALAELLGDDHDLALLDERVRASGTEFDELLELIARRRIELQDEAFRLGRREELVA